MRIHGKAFVSLFVVLSAPCAHSAAIPTSEDYFPSQIEPQQRGVGDVGIGEEPHRADIFLTPEPVIPKPTEGDSVGMSSTITIILSDDEEISPSQRTTEHAHETKRNASVVPAKTNSMIMSPEIKIPGYDTISINMNTPRDNRGVQYEQWMSPQGQVYYVPVTRQENEPVFGAPMYKASDNEASAYEDPITGAEFQITSSPDDSVFQMAQVDNVRQEVDLTMQGFPHFWRKVSVVDECEDDPKFQEETEFPYGASNFVLVGLRKHSVENFTMPEEAAPAEEAPVNASGLRWWRKEDDCEEEEDQVNDHPFGTDHFLFVGAASVNTSNSSTSQEPAATPTVAIAPVAPAAVTPAAEPRLNKTETLEDDGGFHWTAPNIPDQRKDRADLGFFRNRYSNDATIEHSWSNFGAVIVMTSLVLLV